MTPQVSPSPPTPSDDSPPPICPILTLAGETFERELSELLRHSRNKWVAYHGARRVGITRTSTEAFQLCEAQGIHPYQVAIWCIEPQPEVEFIGMG